MNFDNIKYPDKGAPVIRLRDVNVGYDGKPLLRHIDLTLRDGDFLAISGPNGGGKTTLLRIMLKLLRPTSGLVEYLENGEIVKSLKIGYLPQKNLIDTRFPISVEETVKSGLLSGFFGRLPHDWRLRLEQVVELCGIGEYLKRPVGVLSGGQLQRTLIARAVISNPHILMLDEPLSYVDKQFERRIYGIMENLARTTTIVLVSHEMSVISGMANRHLIVDHGITECKRTDHTAHYC